MNKRKRKKLEKKKFQKLNAIAWVVWKEDDRWFAEQDRLFKEIVNDPETVNFWCRSKESDEKLEVRNEQEKTKEEVQEVDVGELRVQDEDEFTANSDSEYVP